MMDKPKSIHIAAISIPAFSHQASILQFSKRLLHLHPHFHITCIFPTVGSPPAATISSLHSLPPSSNLHHIFLPPIPKHDLPQHSPPAVQIQLAVSRSVPSLRNALKTLRSTSSSPSPIVAVIADPFANEALEIAKDLDLLSFVYFPPSAMTLSLFLNLPRLDREVSCEYRDLKEPIQIIPDCSIPINGPDLPEHLQDRSSLSYELLLQRCKRFDLADGFLVNTFLEMEESTITALQQQRKQISLFPIGPVAQPGSESSGSGSGCVEWLENQPPRSVLYVSFGSGGTLSEEQVNELALGLELSGQKFLWVVRAPSNESANAAYLSNEKQINTNNDNDNDSLQFLPCGFLERIKTKGQGLIVSSWAPQTRILSHGSTGGFLTHCGWNSVLESIVFGVPMIAWPLFAEQKMNAVLLTEGLKVGLRPKAKEINGVVGREEIAKVVRDLMEDGEEGKGIRRRIEELREGACGALREGGSSTKALSQFVQRIEDFVRQS